MSLKWHQIELHPISVFSCHLEVNYCNNQLAGWPSGNYVNYKIGFPVRLTGGFVLDIAHDVFRMLRLVWFISYFRDTFLDFANIFLTNHHGNLRTKIWKKYAPWYNLFLEILEKSFFWFGFLSSKKTIFYCINQVNSGRVRTLWNICVLWPDVSSSYRFRIQGDWYECDGLTCTNRTISGLL